MRLRLKQLAKNDKGASLVEFALVFPLLLVVIFGVIEWGLYMYNRQVLTNAVREGARYGVLMRPALRDAGGVFSNDEYEDAEDCEDCEDGMICDKVIDIASTHLITFGDNTLSCDNDDDVTIDRKDPPFGFGNDLSVVVVYNYKFLFLYPILGTSRIEVESTMKME